MSRLISEIQNGVNNGSIKPEINSRFISDNANKAMYMSVVIYYLASEADCIVVDLFNWKKPKKICLFYCFSPERGLMLHVPIFWLTSGWNYSSQTKKAM